MNIFVLHSDPKRCAILHLDKHVVKMILESAQMICTTHHLHPNQDMLYDIPYKKSFVNHPCTKWARKSRANFSWLLSNMSHMFLQKVGAHKSANLIPSLQKYADDGYFPNEELTPFANCARNLERGVDYSEHTDTHEAYRLYMNDRWKERNIALTWRWGKEPEWRD